MDAPKKQDPRSSYRVRYPTGYPQKLIPQVVLEPGRKVDLEDMSEHGVRVRITAPLENAVGEVIVLTITHPEEEPFSAEGTLVWMDEHYAAIHLESFTVPWRILLNEQRAIARWRTRLIEVREERERDH
jgi:PilZ domain